MKNLFLISIIFSLLFSACSNNKPNSESDQNIDSLIAEMKKPKMINMQLDTLTKEFIHKNWNNPDSAAYSFKYQFFKFTAKNSKISNRLNMVLYDLMADNEYFEPLDSSDYNNAASKLISKFNKTKYENPSSAFKWELESKVRTVYYKNPVISFEIDKIGKIQNNNYNNKYFINFDINSGNIIKIEDIIKEGQYNEFLKIAEKSFRDLYKIPKDAAWSQTNFLMWSDGFKLNGNFAIIETGLYYYFNPLDITLENNSSFNLLIAYKDFKHIVKKNSPISIFNFNN